MATNVNTNLLKWQADQASLNKFIQDNNKVAAAQKQAAQAIQQQNKAVETGFQQIVSAAKRGELSVKELRLALQQVGQTDDEIDKITESLKQADVAAKQLQNTSETGLITQSGRQLLRGEREEGRFQSFALGTLGNIPGVGGSQGFGAASAAFDLIDALPNLGFALNAVKASVLENVAAIGVGGAGLIGVLGLGALALKVVTDAEAARGEAAKKTAEQLLSASEQVARGATSADFQAQNEQLERQRTVLEEGQTALEGYRDRIANANQAYGDGITSADEYRAVLGIINAEIHDATGGVLGLKDGLGVSVAQVGDFNGVLAENQANIDGVTSKLAANNIALVSQGVEENNALQRQLARDQRNLAREAAYLQADRLTAEQRQQHIDEIQREVDSYQFLIDNGNLAAETSNELTARIRNLNIEQGAYRDTVDSTADALARTEAEQKALTDQTDAYFKALELEGKAREALFAARQKEADDAAASAQKILDIRADLAEKEAELWRKAGDEITEAEAKAQDNRVKQEQAYYKQVQDIQRRANASIANAIYARDALAAYQAQQQKQEDLRKAKEDNDERLKQIDDALEDQKAVIAKRLEEQLQTQRKAADAAIRTEYDRRRKEQEINNRAIQESLVAYQNAAYATQQIALYGSSGRRIIETQLWQDVNAIAVSWAANTVNTLGNIFGAVFGGGSSGGGSGGGSQGLPTSGYGVPPMNPQIGDTWTDAYGQFRIWNGHGWQAATAVQQFASGTPFVTHDQLAYLHQGERIVSARDNLPSSTSGMSRSTTNINVTLNAKEYRNMSKQEALNAIARVLEA